MIWLRKLFYRRIIRGFKHRMKSLEDLMETCTGQMELLRQERDALDAETLKLGSAPIESLKINTEKYEQFSRIYWDAFNRHEEVESGLMWITKDFDRR